jgi:hypothetical protein
VGQVAAHACRNLQNITLAAAQEQQQQKQYWVEMQLLASC